MILKIYKMAFLTVHTQASYIFFSSFSILLIAVDRYTVHTQASYIFFSSFSILLIAVDRYTVHTQASCIFFSSLQRKVIVDLRKFRIFGQTLFSHFVRLLKMRNIRFLVNFRFNLFCEKCEIFSK